METGRSARARKEIYLCVSFHSACLGGVFCYYRDFLQKSQKLMEIHRNHISSLIFQ
jgi:hypothetical protein